MEFKQNVPEAFKITDALSSALAKNDQDAL